MTGSSSGLGSSVSRDLVSSDPTPREAASMGSGHGAAKTANTRSITTSGQRISSVKNKLVNAAAAKKTDSKPTKPASVATGGNATSVAISGNTASVVTRRNASQSETSLLRTPNNMQAENANDFLMDLDLNIEFGNPAKQAGLYESKHAPSGTRAPRSEPVRTRSRAAASSQASSQAPSTSASAIIGKRKRPRQRRGTRRYRGTRHHYRQSLQRETATDL
ncbi:hypothetical protein N7522_003414 [Penicillium canescens]|nr:hypothetical protein N7522_003414 [Penicillium canescens]